jgi:hypothetical protein
MKPKLTVYVTDDELAQFKREAARRRLSLSRYMKERFLPIESDRALDGGTLGPNMERRLADAVRRAADAHSRKLLDQISTLIVMVDQLAARTLGEACHQDWQQQVEVLVRELRGEGEPELNGAQG